MSKYIPVRPLIACLLLLLPVQLPAQDARIRITTADGLPRHTYQVPESATRLVEDDAQFAALAARLTADLRGDLDRYDIADRATLKQYYSTLGSLALLDGRHDVAVAYADSVRGIEDKPALRALAGTLERALAAAARGTPAEREQLFRTAFREEIAALPYDIVQAELKYQKGTLEFVSPGVVLGGVQAVVEPAARSGEVSRELATRIVDARFYLRVLQPIQAAAVGVLGDAIAAHATDKPDIWAARDVSLEGRPGLTPVVVGIWDSGVDTSLFDGRLFINAREIPGNGIDDDGNGFVDDVHGIAFDLHGQRTTGMLLPLSYGAAEEAKYRGYLKGFMDLGAGLDSPEGAELKRAAAGLRPEDYTTFFEGVRQYSIHAHGTHVAGIALDGNPAARLLVKRMTFDHRVMPELPSLERAMRESKSARDVAAYFRTADVRVVNMSWGMSPEHLERALELHNAGGTSEERKALARRIYDVYADSLRQVFLDAPDILFIASAGNADSDNRFSAVAPASFDLPNLITAAAVDRAGDEAAFTSYGKVEVYANGYEVESYLPGGERSPLSGTSMAAPQVANLAAKLLAVYPHLTVAQLRQAIIEGADEKTIGDGKRIRLLNPVRSFEIAQRMAAGGERPVLASAAAGVAHEAARFRQ
jgi:subtilisin family serine protease